MRSLWTALSCLAPLSLAFCFTVLARLGRRMGEALRVRPFYLMYLAAAALMAAAVAAALAAGAAGWWSASEGGAAMCAALGVMLPFSAACGLALYATMRYWSWIWPELRAMSRSRKGGGENRG